MLLRGPAVLGSCLVLLTFSGAHAVPLVDDGGSGVDAGDVRDAATPVGYGVLLGNMTPFDADWYTFPVYAGPSCVDLAMQGAQLTAWDLTLGIAGGPEVHRPLNATHDAGFALAVAPGASLLLGLEQVDDSVFAATPDSYAGALSSFVPVRGDDAGSGGDVGDTFAKAMQVPGQCFGGSLVGEDRDYLDVYRFNATAGEVAAYSLAATDSAFAALRLYGPDRAALGPSIRSGELAQVPLDETGTYYLLSARYASSDMDYAIGLVVGPPDPGSPCRPYCLS